MGQCVELFTGGVVDVWVRNTVMLTVLAVWAVFVVVLIARGEADNIPATVWGVPPAMYFALNPSFRKGDKDGQA